MKKLTIALTLVICLLLTGCPSEKNARDSIAAFDGYLTSAVSKHDAECKADVDNKLPVCGIVIRGIRAENAAVTALETYCQLTPGTGKDQSLKCSPVKSLASGLQSAINNMNQLTAEIKGAAK